jgi:RNA polymerase sigma-70 factor (ECF subfamily)
MERVSEKVLEFDRSFIQELMNQPATNSTNLKIAKEMLKDSIAEDLTDKQKEVIYLKYYEQLKNKEIAERLGLDTSTVSRNLKRARERIRKSMRLYMKYNRLIQLYQDE